MTSRSLPDLSTLSLVHHHHHHHHLDPHQQDPSPPTRHRHPSNPPQTPADFPVGHPCCCTVGHTHSRESLSSSSSFKGGKGTDGATTTGGRESRNSAVSTCSGVGGSRHYHLDTCTTPSAPASSVCSLVSKDGNHQASSQEKVRPGFLREVKCSHFFRNSQSSSSSSASCTSGAQLTQRHVLQHQQSHHVGHPLHQSNLMSMYLSGVARRGQPGGVGGGSDGRRWSFASFPTSSSSGFESGGGSAGTSESSIISSPATKLPGEEDYETLKLISNGAYGAVYLVKHRESGERYAMKKINKHNLVLRNQVEQVFAERDIMSFTDNPFVVSMFCSFETKRHLCMVMEYVEGGDCATLLKNMGPLPLDMARFYFAETLLAVEYLHSFGIVHRDLKPDNLLITAMGHIKLTDFGLSKIGLMNLATNLCEEYKTELDRETKQFNDKQVFGTPEYIAPEVILRQGYGKPVDWWSMGIILYEFLVGCVPFFGETPEELFAHVINDEIEWPDDDEWPIPDEAKSLISQLLTPNPMERLGTSGSQEVKDHSFFEGINWPDLLRQKAEFVPHLENEDDTSYFDTRSDRYNHDMDNHPDDEEVELDTDDSSSLFSSFSSCSPRYHKVYSRIERELAEERLLKSSSTSPVAMDIVTGSANASFASIHPLHVFNRQTSASSTSSTPPKTDHHLRKDSSSDGQLPQRTRSVTVANPMEASREVEGCPIIEDDDIESSVEVDMTNNKSTINKIESVEASTSSSPTPSTEGVTSKSSPRIERRKKSSFGSLNRASLPRFSFSMDKDGSPLLIPPMSTPSTPSIREIPPLEDGEEARTLFPTIEIGSGNMLHSPSATGPARHRSLSAVTAPTSSSLMMKQVQPIMLTLCHPHHRQRPHPTTPVSSSSSLTNRPVIKSASAHGLSLIIPPPDELSTLTIGQGSPIQSSSVHPVLPVKSTTCTTTRLPGQKSPGHSSTSSRDTSPNRSGGPLGAAGPATPGGGDMTTILTSQLKPPIIIRRGPRGFGFTLRSIRVYYGDSDNYTIHHLVMSVENLSPAFDAGLRPGDLVTHINGEPLQGLLHPQVLQLVLSGGDKINIRATPLENTTIKTGGRRRNPKTSKLVRRTTLSKSRRTPPIKRTDSDKKRRSTLFRKLSSKRASAELQQLLSSSAASSPIAITPSRSFQSLTQGILASSPTQNPPPQSKSSGPSAGHVCCHHLHGHHGKPISSTPNTGGLAAPAVDSSPGYSSQSSSPGSSVPNSPALVNSPNYQRPSSLHGLKNKLATTRPFRPHGPAANVSSPRRKSCGNIPLSPLARTTSPNVHGLLATSPTRSPSPLAFPSLRHPVEGQSASASPPIAMSAATRKKVLLANISTSSTGSSSGGSFGSGHLHLKEDSSQAK